jgi:hypothetical protein
MQDTWLKGCAKFWQCEILRWEAAGIQIVLENDTEKSPDLLVQLVNGVNNPYRPLRLLPRCWHGTELPAPGARFVAGISPPTSPRT